jgi:hypothetical protein
VYIDKALEPGDAFNVFYKFCQNQTTRQKPWLQELEFVEMVRVLNPKLGQFARNFFPASYTDDKKRIVYLSVKVANLREYSTIDRELVLDIGQQIRSGRANNHMYNLAYIRLVNSLRVYAWGEFVNSRAGISIGASVEPNGVFALDKLSDSIVTEARATRAAAVPGPSASAPASATTQAAVAHGTFKEQPVATVLTPQDAQLYLSQQTHAQISTRKGSQRRENARIDLGKPTTPTSTNPRARPSDIFRRLGAAVPRPVADPSVAWQGPAHNPVPVNRRAARVHIQITSTPLRTPRVHPKPTPQSILNHL